MDHGGSERPVVKTTDKDARQLKLRLPTALKEWLHEQARTARRSLTAEITVRLEEARERQLAKQQPAPILTNQTKNLKGNL
jgi:hypothetical protein